MTGEKKVCILGIPIDKVGMGEALERISGFLEGEGLSTVYTPNAEMVMTALEDGELLNILKAGHLVVPDGIGLVHASRVYGDSLPERVAGYDLMLAMMDLLNRRGESIFLLGGKPGVADKAAQEISARFPALVVKGCYHGYFKDEEIPSIVDRINSVKPEVVFVALGSPKQEKWIYNYRGRLNAKIAMGVGGSFDVLAGNVKRAPAVFRRTGMEWFYRLVTQPWRARRMAALPRFAVRVLLDRGGGRRA